MKKLKLKRSIAFAAVASIPLFAGCWLLGSGEENLSLRQALAYSEANIQSRSGENALLSDTGSLTGERIDYELPSWTFGVFPGVSAPRLEHGDEFLFAGVPQPDGYRLICNNVVVVDGMEIADGWDPKTPGGQYDIATFTLARTYREVEEIICKDEIRSNWWKYFNDYMPVGKYSITFNVSTVSVTQHTHWWNDEVHGDGTETAYGESSHSFTFEVYADTFTIDDSDFNSYESVNAYEVNIKALQGGDYSAFFLPSSGATFSPNIITRSMVQAEGDANYWAVNADKYFDEEPQMGYNLGSMYNNVYLPESADWSEYIDTPASYKVFYMATMKNYESVPSMSDERYTKFFNVIVYREVSIPVLSQTEFVYTGQEITAETSADIPPAERVLYSVSGNRQTNAGNHKATFTLVDRVHYKWEGGSSEADCEVPFEIVKAPVTLPTLTPRVYTGSAQKADITALKDHNNLPIFTIIHGDGHSDGSYTEAGTYEIVLALRDPDNYRWVDEEGVNVAPSGEIAVDFVIDKATDSWATPVQLLSWHYGSYHTVYNAVSGAAASTRTVYYTVADAEQTVFAELDAFTVNDDYADELTNLSCGEYYIRASVTDGTNYLPLSSEWMKFEVLPGYNEWTETPGITPWRYGEYDEEINRAYGAAAHGETEFVFYRLNGDGERIGDGYPLMSEFADEDDYNRIPGGTYEMTVSSSGGENYAGLEQSIVFEVLPGINYWEVTPNIEHWVYGNVPGRITGRARFGEPVFTVVTTDGVEIYNSVTGKNELSAQRPGNYILKARVEETSNYLGLNDYEVEFKVFGTLTNVWLVLPAIQGWPEGDPPN
ncbi:MAG: hypothetical protein K2L87_04775, partial [Clostridiales bacterium]|nr:hypothetical protein [Clostridiales bacterium]